MNKSYVDTLDTIAEHYLDLRAPSTLLITNME